MLGLSGCGGDAEETSADDPPSTSASSPTSEPSESESASEVSGDDSSPDAFIERLKASMGEEGSMHVSMDMTGPAEMQAEGDSSYGPDGSEMHLTMNMAAMPDGPIEMILADGKAYMSMPGLTEEGQFFEIDESNPAFGTLGNGLTPADTFDAFEAGLTKVDELGEEQIDGEPTTRYRLHVGAEEALEATGQEMVPGLPDELVYEVWLDSEDKMRRLTYELMGMELTMDMTRWGEPVEIEAPSEDDLIAPPAGV